MTIKHVNFEHTVTPSERENPADQRPPKPVAAAAGNLVVEQPEFLRRHTSSWRDEARCLGVDPALFFPEKGESTQEAKAVCNGCVVREPCLGTALDDRETHGIWGGKSERERRRIRRQRHQAARATLRLASQDGTPEDN